MRFVCAIALHGSNRYAFEEVSNRENERNEKNGPLSRKALNMGRLKDIAPAFS
jgi:hypothetical protein